VNSAALAGQPVSAVREQLRQLGLHPRVVHTATGQQAPGTVISVQPSGQVPAGSVVVVTAAGAPSGDGNGHGHGDNGTGGNGDGNGDGGG
jgi:beta-lactam-binding protein with PASTA domain